MIRRPPRSTPLYSSAASDVYKRQHQCYHGLLPPCAIPLPLCPDRCAVTMWVKPMVEAKSWMPGSSRLQPDSRSPSEPAREAEGKKVILPRRLSLQLTPYCPLLAKRPSHLRLARAKNDRYLGPSTWPPEVGGRFRARAHPKPLPQCLDGSWPPRTVAKCCLAPPKALVVHVTSI